MSELTNPRAQRVRSVKALSGRSARSKTGLFLVEGPQGVREAVRFAAQRVRDIYVTPDSQERYGQIMSAARAQQLYVHVASPEVMAAMSSDSQGILAVVRTSEPAIEDVLASEPKLLAILSNVRDPGNAGTVIRAADAAGADGVILTSHSVDIHNPKTVRSTAGSLFHLPVVTGIEVGDAVHRLRESGLAILAADGSGEHDLDDLQDAAGSLQAPGPTSRIEASVLPDLCAPTAWLFGNEAWGLPREERNLADAVVRVPIRGAAESLNLATAATVCLYASSRAQR